MTGKRKARLKRASGYSQTDFTGGFLSNYNFTGADLTDANMTDVSFSNTNFQDAILDGVDFTGCTETSRGTPASGNLPVCS